MPNLRRKVSCGISIVLSASLLAGCGEVDLGQLKPKVWKPAAAVILVDHPAAWSASQVESDLASAGAVANVVETSSEKLRATLDSYLKGDPIGFIGIVANGTVPRDVFQTVATHSATRFEIIEKTAAPKSTVNLKQVFPNPNAVAYASGWLAGQLTVTDAKPTVGWFVNGSSQASKNEMRTALSAVYMANPNVNIVPITLGSTQPAVFNTLPKQVITGNALTNNQVATFHTSGCQVISLVPQLSANDVLSQPGLPDEHTLRNDVAAYVKLDWQPGRTMGQLAPFLALNGSVLPASVLSSVNQCQLSLQANPAIGTNAWATVPQPIQQLLEPIVSTGS